MQGALMIKKHPLITIGITCFNAEDTIERAINSAIDQDYSNIEIVIVDDLSKDSSLKIIKRLSEEHININVINHTKNKGVAAARNSIIKNAQGEFIAFFDDDDISRPNRVSVQYEAITSYEKEHKTDLVACWASGYKQYDNGYQAIFQAIGSKPLQPKGQDVINYQLFMGKKPGVFFGSGTPSCSLMTRKRLYTKIGVYDVNMRRIEDTDFALRLAKNSGHFIGCSEHLIVQSASTGADKRPDIGYQAEYNLIEKHKNLFDSNRRYLYALQWSKLRLYHFSQKRCKTIGMMLKLFLQYPIWTSMHFTRSVPQRMLHELKMKKRK